MFKLRLNSSQEYTEKEFQYHAGLSPAVVLKLRETEASWFLCIWLHFDCSGPGATQGTLLQRLVLRCLCEAERDSARLRLELVCTGHPPRAALGSMSLTPRAASVLHLTSSSFSLSQYFRKHPVSFLCCERQGSHILGCGFHQGRTWVVGLTSMWLY